MGDVLSLVEKAEESIKADEADEMTKRIMQQKFDFNDFLKQSQMMSGMGGMGNLTKMLPGLHTWTTCHAVPVSNILASHVSLPHVSVIMLPMLHSWVDVCAVVIDCMFTGDKRAPEHRSPVRSPIRFDPTYELRSIQSSVLARPVLGSQSQRWDPSIRCSQDAARSAHMAWSLYC